MTNPLLLENDRKKALSRACVAAVAACSGFTTSYEDYGRGGIDPRIHGGDDSSPFVAVQPKSTSSLGTAKNGKYHYRLERKNYDVLKKPTLRPQILLVLSPPLDEADWLSVSKEEPSMRKCCLWADLSGLPEENKEKVTIHLSEENLFDVQALKQPMKQSCIKETK